MAIFHTGGASLRVYNPHASVGSMLYRMNYHKASRGVRVDTHKEVAAILDQALGLKGRSALFTSDTALLGSIPELDSMAVVSILTSIEDHFGFTVEDTEISADTFSTLGTLVTYVELKLG